MNKVVTVNDDVDEPNHTIKWSGACDKQEKNCGHSARESMATNLSSSTDTHTAATYPDQCKMTGDIQGVV